MKNHKEINKTFFLSDYTFEVFIRGGVRHITITDSGPQGILGFGVSLMIPFTIPKHISNKSYKYKNERNISELKEFCELVLNELDKTPILDKKYYLITYQLKSKIMYDDISTHNLVIDISPLQFIANFDDKNYECVVTNTLEITRQEYKKYKNLI